MDKKKVKGIIENYIDGNASQKEKKLLNNFLNSYQVTEKSDKIDFDQSQFLELKKRIISLDP